MSILSQAPLIETIFELRWGEIQVHPSNPRAIRLMYSENELETLDSSFGMIAEKHGFPIVEQINPELSQLPHSVSKRYRKQLNVWPCYQTGLGIFTVNQINDGYKWSIFKKDILLGLELLDEACPGSLSSLSSIGVELRYLDGFPFDENENSNSFLKNKMELGFNLPNEFFANEKISNEIRENNIRFEVATNKPKGLLINCVESGMINGRSGFVMNTIVRSADKNSPDFDVKELEKWLNDAHEIQQHAFKTLIQKKYARTFK